MASSENINKIRSYEKAIDLIKNNYFKNVLPAANATMTKQLSQTLNVEQTLINTIYQPATDLHDELMREYANIIDMYTRDKTNLIMLQHANANAIAIVSAGVSTTVTTNVTTNASANASVDTISPEIMIRDTVTLYNTQYLQIFCKVLGIVIIIAIFCNYFSSITGVSSASSIIPQSLSLPVAST
jgi:hypothetical protein